MPKLAGAPVLPCSMPAAAAVRLAAMESFFGSVWWMLVTLGVLITFHEFGHFIVARRLGVRVLRFSVGFGRPLLRRVGRSGTEYVIAAIPLGGYVKMLDEREGDVAPEDAPSAFNRQPLAARTAIVAAGPVFNLVFTVFALWLMFVFGKPDFLPLVGRTQGIAAEAGFVRGDRLTDVGGRAVTNWSDASIAIATASLDRDPLPVRVIDSRGGERTRILSFASLPDNGEPVSVRALGLMPKQSELPADVGEVEPDSPAARAGLRAGDRIVGLAGERIASFDELYARMQEQAAGAEIELTVKRDDSLATLGVVPRAGTREDGSRAITIGISVAPVTAQYDTERRYGPLAAIPAALRETWQMTRDTYTILGKLLTGQASLRNISGPVSIAQYADLSADLGVAWFLSFLAMVSLSLAVMNLLPIPILDGGHLLYYLIEFLKGSPVTERTLAVGQFIGLAMLVGLMGLAFYNDIHRLIS